MGMISLAGYPNFLFKVFTLYSTSERYDKTNKNELLEISDAKSLHFSLYSK